MLRLQKLMPETLKTSQVFWQYFFFFFLNPFVMSWFISSCLAYFSRREKFMKYCKNEYCMSASFCHMNFLVNCYQSISTIYLHADFPYFYTILKEHNILE